MEGTVGIAISDGDPELTTAIDSAPEIVEPHDFYCSYRGETNNYSYSDKEIALRLGSALQNETGLDGKPINVYVPQAEPWETRLFRGLSTSAHILLIVSEDGLRPIRNADHCEDITLLEYEYALSQKMKGLKKVMLLLVKNEDGSNFSSFDTSVYPSGDVSKAGISPCHKSKRSAAFWDNGSKCDLLRKDAKPGEHSIRDTMDALFGLQGVHVSAHSADIKKVCPSQASSDTIIIIIFLVTVLLLLLISFPLSFLSSATYSLVLPISFMLSTQKIIAAPGER